MENTPKRKIFRKTEEEKAAIKAQNQEILAAWKAEKEEKKQARKEARALRKARRRARPLWQKVLINCTAIAVVIALAVGLFPPATQLIGAWLGPKAEEAYFTGGYQEPDLEYERSVIPADTLAQEAIQAMPGYNKEDTWAIYMYVIGSDLESYDQNDLSDMQAILAAHEQREVRERNSEYTSDNLHTYLDAITAAGLELPGPMYYADPPAAASSVPVTNDVVIAERIGAASQDLDEVRAVTLPENINVVIQTGGAAHWTNPRINPNRVQTFLYSGNTLTEEVNKPAYSLSTVDALTDFLNYCKTNHDADHKVLILWNHGGGAFGYGVDEIFGNMLSLKQIGEALAATCTADPENPEFEVIGFDACLMAGAEIMKELDGYGRYFVGSEETEPGFGWFYTDWLNQLIANPGMNGAQLGLAIADSYMDFYARISNNFYYKVLDIPVNQDDLTFCVLDLHKAAAVYDAYTDLMEAALPLSMKDDGVLTGISQAARSAIHYGGTSAYVINTIDIGTFMNNMPKELAKEAKKVQDALHDSVLYVRSSSSLMGSTGLSIYFPDATIKRPSVSYLMDYITSISDNEAMNALYFYKATGCLTEDMQTYLTEKGLGEWKPLNLDALGAVEGVPIEPGNQGGYSVQVSPEAQDRINKIGHLVGRVEDDIFTQYGISTDAALSDQGVLSTDFDGKWISLAGQPLDVDVVFDGAESTTYHAPILLNGREATLVFSCSKRSGAYTILGAYLDEKAIAGDFIGRNVSDLQIGSIVTPVYNCSNVRDGSTSTKEGDTIYWDGRAKIELQGLPNGDYLSMITFSSIRGDEFNTGIVEMTIQNGLVTNMVFSDGYAVIHSN